MRIIVFHWKKDVIIDAPKQTMSYFLNSNVNNVNKIIKVK